MGCCVTTVKGGSTELVGPEFLYLITDVLAKEIYNLTGSVKIAAFLPWQKAQEFSMPVLFLHVLNLY